MSGPETVGGAPENDAATTDDAFLGQLLRIRQPRHGYRAGVDAVLLAATVTLTGGRAARVLDCGAGVGTVGLCVAARCPGAAVTLVERELPLAALARANVLTNDLQDRVTVVAGDITAAATSPLAPSIAREAFDIVLANPPFHDSAGGTHARDMLKQAAHAMPPDELDLWARFAARAARPGGRVTVIQKASMLPDLLSALQDRFGGLDITPVHAYASAPAIRVLMSGTKGSRAPLNIRPALVLHEPDGSFTPYVGRILRHGAGLEDGNVSPATNRNPGED